MTTLKLILGDQLNERHSWFDRVDSQTVFTLMEIRQETDYVLHHAQKVIAIFAAMRDFAKLLKSKGHTVDYVAIDNDLNKQSLDANLDWLIDKHRSTSFEYQEPDEYRLDQVLKSIGHKLPIKVKMVSNEHFYTDRTARLVIEMDTARRVGSQVNLNHHACYASCGERYISHIS